MFKMEMFVARKCKIFIVRMKKLIAEYYLINMHAPSNVDCLTDCLVNSLGCMRFYDETLNVWLDLCIESKNTLRDKYINR